MKNWFRLDKATVIPLSVLAIAVLLLIGLGILNGGRALPALEPSPSGPTVPETDTASPSPDPTPVASPVGPFNLQEQMDATPSGGELVLPDGLLDLDGQTAILSKPMRLKGGVGSLINGHLIIRDTRDVSVEGLETSGFFITVTGVHSIVIDQCSFRDLTGDVPGAITLRSGGENVTIRNCTFEDIPFGSSATTYGCGVKMEAKDTVMKGLDISNNVFRGIHGPAAIWIGGSDLVLDGFSIRDNTVQWTESFGIEFYQIGKGTVTLKNGQISGNLIEDIGLLREPGKGNGSGAIYSSCTAESVDVVGNTIRRVAEIGIEGKFTRVLKNYIEDTGTDQLNHTIGDNAAIYWGGREVSDNVIVNPGDNGGIHLYTEGIIQDLLCERNTISLTYEGWEPGHAYETGDFARVENLVYICIQAGRSGKNPPSGKHGNVTDGSCRWDYKKIIPKAAIRLNGVGGLERVTLRGNLVEDFSKFAYLSGYLSAITIQENVQTNGGKMEKILSGDGYGSRKCPELSSQLISFPAISLP